MSHSLIVASISELVTNDPSRGDGSPLGLIRDAALVVQDGRVAWIGPDDKAPAADRLIDAEDGAVIPGFVDSHTHLVFAGDRAAEFSARMGGDSYTGGGILTTVDSTRSATDGELGANVTRLRDEALRQGTTTLEIKSGYGLSTSDEARCLALARQATPETTFLGAHVVPAEYEGRADDYVSLVCGDMLDAAAPHARWVDVFCERGAFDEDQTRAVLEAGIRAGLMPRLHAGQLGPGPGIRLAVELGAASADHCTYVSDSDVDALANSSTVATLLPGAEFSTRSRYADARRLVDAGVTVALASDCNPGSSYTSAMPFCVALAVRDLGLTPAEALWAATAGGARALRRGDVGHLGIGSVANLAILAAPSYLYLAYRPGVPLVQHVLLNGEPT